MKTAKAYRNGTIEVGDHSPSVVESWLQYDAHKPAGRAGRLDSIYASPSMAGVVRWVRSNHLFMSKKGEVDLNTYELSITDAENIYVYSIELYDRFFSYDGISEEKAKAYWESGIRLSEWNAVALERGLDASNWEVLIPKDKVKSSKKVSDNMIVKVASGKVADELKRTLKDRKDYLKCFNWEPAA